MIDGSVRLGDFVPLVGYVLAAFIAVIAIRKDLQYLARDVVAQGLKIDKLELVVTAQALNDQRLTMLEKTVEDLRRGKGYIRGPRGVDREYNDDEDK